MPFDTDYLELDGTSGGPGALKNGQVWYDDAADSFFGKTASGIKDLGIDPTGSGTFLPLFDEDSESAQTDDDSGGWETKVQVDIPAVDGKFRIDWSAYVTSDGVGRCRIRNSTDGANLLDQDWRFKPTDNQDDDRTFAGTLYFQQTAIAGVKTIELQYRHVGGNEIRIWDATISRWRVGD